MDRELDEQKVAILRTIYEESSCTVREIADVTGYAKARLDAAIRGDSWQDVPGIVEVRHKQRERHKDERHTLTSSDVREARRRAKEGESVADISRDMGASAHSVGASIRGETWGEIQDPPPLDRRDGEWRRKLTPEQVIDLRRTWRDKNGSLTKTYLAKEYDVSPGTIRRAVRGESYQEVGGPVLGSDYTEGPE